jgi:hypothetical protein
MPGLTRHPENLTCKNGSGLSALQQMPDTGIRRNDALGNLDQLFH